MFQTQKEFYKLLLQASELMKWFRAKASGCRKPAWGIQVSLSRWEQCSAWSPFLGQCHLAVKQGKGRRILGRVALPQHESSAFPLSFPLSLYVDVKFQSIFTSIVAMTIGLSFHTGCNLETWDPSLQVPPLFRSSEIQGRLCQWRILSGSCHWPRSSLI